MMTDNSSLERIRKARIYHQADLIPRSDLPMGQMFEAGRTTNNRELKGNFLKQINT